MKIDRRDCGGHGEEEGGGDRKGAHEVLDNFHSKRVWDKEFDFIRIRRWLVKDWSMLA